MKNEKTAEKLDYTIFKEIKDKKVAGMKIGSSNGRTLTRIIFEGGAEISFCGFTYINPNANTS